MAEINGLDAVVAMLKQRAESARKEASTVVTGYENNHALYVHENIEMKWRGKPRQPSPPHRGVYWGPHGEAKFLEKPARTLSSDGTIGDIIRRTLAAGESLETGLLISGLRIQRDSQELVPVDFGNLKNSAFTAVDKGS